MVERLLPKREPAKSSPPIRSRLDPADSMLGPGQPLPSATQARMERALGHRFSDVRVHPNDDLTRAQGADALAVGKHVGLAGSRVGGGLVDDALLAHELAHVVQAGDSSSSEVRHDATLEREADHAAAHAALTLSTPGPHPAAPPLQRGAPGGMRLRSCGSTPTLSADAQFALQMGDFTQSSAEEVLTIYQQMDDGERQAFVERYAQGGALESMMGVLRNTSYSQIIWGGRFVEPLRDLLQRVQRFGMLQYAAGRGLADRGAIVRRQAATIDQRNRDQVMRNRPANAPPPARSEFQQAHRDRVESTSIARQTATMTPERQRQSTADCQAAVRVFVAWAQQEHPELNITEANLQVDVLAVFNRGRNVIAFEGSSGGGCGGGGTPQAVVGEAFTEAVNLNPAYALPVVIHELYGHREYGEPELGQQIYDESVPHMETYGAPRAGAESDAFGYQETEIYSLMRQLEYFTPTAPEHSGVRANFDPGAMIQTRIGLISRQFDPDVAESLVRGLWMRVRLDPRLVPAALDAFRAGVRSHFAARAEDILQ